MLKLSEWHGNLNQLEKKLGLHANRAIYECLLERNKYPTILTNIYSSLSQKTWYGNTSIEKHC